jgi:hypothetical protein
MPKTMKVLDNAPFEVYYVPKGDIMNEPMAKQDNLNRLYAQILKIDEDGKDFLQNIVTGAAASRGFAGMAASAGDMPDENRPKTGVEP